MSTAGQPPLAAAAPAAAPPDPWTEHGHVQVLGARMHYVGCGSGEVLVLLPMMGGWVADWRIIAPQLATRYRVIAIDPPGYGDSIAAGPPPYLLTIEESAAAVAATLNLLGIDSYDLVGNSLGGDIGLAMAVFWPRRVRHLVMISSSLGPPLPLRALRERDARNFYSRFDANDVALPATAEEIGTGWFRDPAWIAQSNASRIRAGAWLKPSSRGISHADFPDWLRRVLVPTLLVYGEDGHFANFEREALAALADGRSVRTPSGSSFPHIDYPDETARLLFDFLGARAPAAD